MNAQTTNRQVLKAIALIVAGNVILLKGENYAKVRSQNTEGIEYKVTRSTCNCKGAQKWGHCKHSLALRMVVDAIRAAQKTSNVDAIIQALGVTISEDILQDLRTIAKKAISHVQRFPVQEKGQRAA